MSKYAPTHIYDNNAILAAARDLKTAVWEPAAEIKRLSNSVAHTAGLIARVTKRIDAIKDSLQRSKECDLASVKDWEFHLSDNEKFLNELRVLLNGEIDALRKALSHINTLASDHAIEAVAILTNTDKR